MKKLILTASVLALLAAHVPAAKAGGCEWATVGAVLTGVAAGVTLASALDCDSSTTVTVGYRAPVTYVAPAPIVYAPRRVVIAPAPVVYAPRVVYTRPVYVAPAPVLVYSKYGHGYHHRGRVHRY
jgi:hypothetical protein